MTATLFCLITTSQTRSVAGINCQLGINMNKFYSKANALDSIMRFYTSNRLPGTAIAVYSEAEGWWANAYGYSNTEKKIPMTNCHLQYLQSVSKSYMAVEILQLAENGKIHLDSPMTQYLPVKYKRYIKNAGKISIRMLLNQTSGVPEYNNNPAFVSHVIQHPMQYFTAADCLKTIANEELQFEPGTKYKYTNTNYLLLSLIGDQVTGDHAAFIRKNIFNTLGLVNTRYGNNHTYLNGVNVPDTYWDVLNAGRPANVSQFQLSTVVSSKGDDGIVATPVDAIKFLRGLMEGKLINQKSLDMTLDFVKNEQGHKTYGMGIIYFDLGGVPAYGHGGGGIGAGCALLYIPSRKLYAFFATNLGVLVEGDLVKKTGEMRDAIIATLLK